MLKKYKYEMQKYQLELEKQKVQNKLLMSKLRILPNGEKTKEKKKSFEESISFQLSKD